MNYQSVIGRGTVRFVEGGEKLTALQALMQHYHCPDLPFEPEMVEHTTVLALDVAAMTGNAAHRFKGGTHHPRNSEEIRRILIWNVKNWLPVYLSPHWMPKKFNRCRITIHLRYPALRRSATDAAVLPLVLERGVCGLPGYDGAFPANWRGCTVPTLAWTRAAPELTAC